MITAVCRLKSMSPYSQSKVIEIEQGERESHADFEKRAWRGRMHRDANGYVVMPPMAFKNCLSEAAKYRSEKIKGAGQKTWTAKFEAGVLVPEGVSLPIKVDDVRGEWLFVPSDGKRGGSKRVLKCFGIIDRWEVEVTYLIFDESITQDIFTNHLKDAGAFIGLGRFRPRNNGYYGRFDVESIDWKEVIN